VDQQIEFLKAVATQETIPYLNGDNETCTYNVKDVLNDVFFIIRPTENPYALEHYQRTVTAPIRPRSSPRWPPPTWSSGSPSP
jgi:hypothetical protein